MPYRIGKYTLGFDQPPAVLSYAAVGSKKESEGPLKDAFDFIEQDSYFGEKSWERAESRIQRESVNRALEKGNFDPTDIDYIFAGPAESVHQLCLWPEGAGNPLIWAVWGLFHHGGISQHCLCIY